MSEKRIIKDKNRNELAAVSSHIGQIAVHNEMTEVMDQRELATISNLIKQMIALRLIMVEKSTISGREAAMLAAELFEDLGNRCFDISYDISAKVAKTCTISKKHRVRKNTKRLPSATVS